MENLKIRVTNEAESCEAIDMLVSLGYEKSYTCFNRFGFVWASGGKCGTDYISFFEGYNEEKEITLPELRDMVVLKRNDVGDKTHYCDSTNSDYFVSSDNTVYFFDDEKTNSWKISNYDLSELKPIEKKETLNDKVASAEEYRKAEVLPSIDDEPKEKHSHYKKDISHLNILDVYRVLELFEVDSPCLQHAIKKLLCAGQRGAKDAEKDIQEAIDTLIRHKRMREEDNA